MILPFHPGCVLVLAWAFSVEPGGDDPIPLAAAARAFREAEERALADDGALWGHSLLAPILLADPTTRAVVANQPDEPAAGGEERLVEREGVFVGTLPPEVGIANTATEWAGVRWTMVMWPLPENRYARTRLLLHECFHRIQPLLSHGGGDALNGHLDTEIGRTWLRLEFRALAEACVRREGARQRALEDALLFRAQRRTLFPEAAAREASFERNEGLAEYTGLKLCGLPDWVLADRAAQKLERDESSASFVRSFAYATGPALGVLLDELGASWRAALDAKSDLAAILAAHIGWKAPAELAQEAGVRAAHYDGPEVVAAEARRAVEKARLDARNRARFVEGPQLELSLGAKLEYSFDFNAITALEGAGNVYGVIRIVDEWGILDAESGGALVVPGPNGSPRLARVPAPPDPGARPLAGDGWTLVLEPGWELAEGERTGDWRVARKR
jgi:hypothetical protein